MPDAYYYYLSWSEFDPPYEVVRGHVSDDEAIRIVSRQVDGPFDKIERTYGRLIPDSTGQYDRIFRTSDKGRGAFPVTLVYYENPIALSAA